MTCLVQLLAAAALVSLLCYEVGAQLDNGKNDLDNNLQPNPAPKQRRLLHKSVKMTSPPPQSARLQSRLQLECQVAGAPAPTVHWLKNGEPITDYEDEANEIPTHHPSSIAILTSRLVVTDAAAGDVFTCVATAAMKEVTASTTIYSEGEESPKLLTLEKLFSVPSKPVITTFYESVFQESGTTLIMPCRVHSSSEHQVFWQDNYGEVVYGNSRIRVLPSGDLLIVGLRWSDMGGWVCIAKNMYGRDSTETFLYPMKPSKQ